MLKTLMVMAVANPHEHQPSSLLMVVQMLVAYLMCLCSMVLPVVNQHRQQFYAERLLLLMDCTTFSELLDVILKDTAVFFCIIEDTTVVFEDTAASFFLASYAALDSRDD